MSCLYVETSIKAGPHARFRAIYRDHYGLVWSAARRLGVQEYQVDDVVQETFLVAYRRFETFDGRSAPAWLYGITRRVVSNHRRSERRASRREDAIRRYALCGTPTTPDTMEAWHSLARFLASLSEREQEVFVLCEIEGMSGAEVARALRLRPSTTYDAIRGLRKRFETWVSEQPNEVRLGAVAKRARLDRPGATRRSWTMLVAALPRGGGGMPLLGPRSSWLPVAPTLLSKFAVASTGVVLLVAGMTSVSAPASGSVDASQPKPAPFARAARSGDGNVNAEAPGVLVKIAAPPAARVPSQAFQATGSAHPKPGRPPKRTRSFAEQQEHDDLAHQNALLRAAKQALQRGDVARSLSLAEQHITEHPHSPLYDASVALRVQSLCALGRVAEANGAAATLLRSRPGSPVAERMGQGCKKGRTPPRSERASGH